MPWRAYPIFPQSNCCILDWLSLAVYMMVIRLLPLQISAFDAVFARFQSYRSGAMPIFDLISSTSSIVFWSELLFSSRAWPCFDDFMHAAFWGTRPNAMSHSFHANCKWRNLSAKFLLRRRTGIPSTDYFNPIWKLRTMLWLFDWNIHSKHIHSVSLGE